jgi:DNA-binding transcriptional MerR regulator
MSTYTPAQTVDRTGFSIETLRYYERVGLLRDVPRDGAGHRAFTDEHLSWLKILRCLRDTGMPIAQMQRYVELAVHDGPIPARLELLEQHDHTVTRQIAELRHWQKHLREKIAGYQRQVAQAG